MSDKRKRAEDVIEALGLSPHVEGGYYSQLYRSQGEYKVGGKLRAYATSIYFLLKSGQISRLHSLKSDELWYFHFGCPLRITILAPDGALSEQILGNDILSGQQPQLVIPAGSVFGAELLGSANTISSAGGKASTESYFPAGSVFGAALVESGFEDYALVSCMVAPGFEFEDFTMPSKKDLEEKFPQHVAIIERLTV